MQNQLESPISRREFLEKGALFAGGAFVAGVAADMEVAYQIYNAVAAARTGGRLAARAANYLIDPTNSSENSKRGINFPSPGWLEYHNRQGLPPLVDGRDKDGHKNFLMHVALHDKLLNNPDWNNPGILQIALREYFATPPIFGHPPLLGNEFNKHLGYARAALQKEFPGRNVSDENALHLALYSFAVIFSPYLTRDDITSPQKLNVPISNAYWMEHDKEIPWWMKVYGKHPRVYPLSITQCTDSAMDIYNRCLGADRVVHFAQFAWLAHMYFLAQKDKIPEIGRVPRAAKIMSDFLGRDIYDKVQWFMRLSGIALEISESVKWMREKAGIASPGEMDLDEYNRILATGFFDSTVAQDLWADELGTDFVLDYHKGLRLQELVERLNSASINSIPQNKTVFSQYDIFNNTFIRELVNFFNPGIIDMYAR
ncbi:hypothetical protein M1271_01010 [Patescibacteria group bacterium]|nr:hypothetical protein [Patescibacteria group bacterium]